MNFKEKVFNDVIEFVEKKQLLEENVSPILLKVYNSIKKYKTKEE